MRKLIYGIAVVMTLCIPGLILGWTAPVNISNTPINSNCASIAIGKDNTIHVVWQDFDDPYDYVDILYSYCDGDSWTVPLRIARASGYSGDPDIVIDSSGCAHVAWYDFGRGEIYWSYYNGDSWSTPFNISDKPGADYGPKMVIDTRNRIHIVWHEYGGDIWYSMYDGDSWSTPSNISNAEHSVAWPDIAVDSQGHLYVVWMNYGDYETNFDIYYSKYDGASWSTPINISNLPGYSCRPRIAIDSKDHPYVVWEERHSGYHIYYTAYNGTFWSTPYRISIDNGFDPVTAIGSQNNVCVAWGAGRYGLWYRFYNGIIWSNLDTVSSIGILPAITRDAHGCFHLVWTKGEDGRSNIWYSKYSLTGVEAHETGYLPKKCMLYQNSPNPFISRTKISYRLTKSNHVTITIFDLVGKVVKKLELGYKSAGSYTLQISTELLKKGDEAYAGVYFYRLQAGSYTATKKMISLR